MAPPDSRVSVRKVPQGQPAQPLRASSGTRAHVESEAVRGEPGASAPPPDARDGSADAAPRRLRSDATAGSAGRSPPAPPSDAQAAHRSLQDPALVEYFRRTIQPDGVRVLNTLADAGEGTDEKIAELAGVNLYLVRKILYILYELRLTEYRRQRNEENGWLTYHWTVNWREMEAHLAREVKKLAHSLRTRLEHERDNLFYACPQEGSRLLFGAASEAQFRCPSCGATLQAVDNRALVTAIESRLDELVQAWPRALDGED